MSTNLFICVPHRVGGFLSSKNKLYTISRIFLSHEQWDFFVGKYIGMYLFLYLMPKWPNTLTLLHTGYQSI